MSRDLRTACPQGSGRCKSRHRTPSTYHKHLTQRGARVARRRRENGAPIREIARTYNVSPATIARLAS